MTTFFFFGSYAKDSLPGIDAKRTKQAETIIKGYGGTLRSIYALLGSVDLVLIAEMPGIPEAMETSLAISKATGIRLSTAPAVPVAEFDELARAALKK